MRRIISIIIYIIIFSNIVISKSKADDYFYYFAVEPNDDLYNKISSISKYNKYIFIVDENKNFNEYGQDFIDLYLNKLFEKYSFTTDVHNNSRKYNIVFDTNNDFNILTDIPFNEPLFLSSKVGLLNVKVIGYYFESGSDFEGAHFFPILILEKENNFEYCDNGLYILTNNSKSGEIIDKKDDDLTIYGYGLKLLKKYRDKLNFEKTISWTPEENINFYKGSFTLENETQYLVSWTVQSDLMEWSSVIFIMDKTGNLIKKVKDFRGLDFHFNDAIGVVDINGDDLNEIIINYGYHEGCITELWAYQSGNYVLISSGFEWGI
jgi:hypothetical protein